MQYIYQNSSGYIQYSLVLNGDFFGMFELHNIDMEFVCSMALGTSTYRNNKRRYDHDIFNLIKSAEEELPKAPYFPIKIAFYKK